MSYIYIYAVNVNEQLKAAQRLAMRSCKIRALNTVKSTAKSSDEEFDIKYTTRLLIIVTVVLVAIIAGLGYTYDFFVVARIVCCAVIVFAIFYIIRMRKRRTELLSLRKSKAEPIKSLTLSEERLYKEDVRKISNAIVQTTTQNQSVLNVIPRDYRNYDAVAYFEQVLANKRAYSMQEAVNLYEQHLYQLRMELRMEDKNRQLLEQAQQQTRLLREIEFNTDFATTYMILSDMLR